MDEETMLEDIRRSLLEWQNEKIPNGYNKIWKDKYEKSPNVGGWPDAPQKIVERDTNRTGIGITDQPTSYMIVVRVYDVTHDREHNLTIFKTYDTFVAPKVIRKEILDEVERAHDGLQKVTGIFLVPSIL